MSDFSYPGWPILLISESPKAEKHVSATEQRLCGHDIGPSLPKNPIRRGFCALSRAEWVSQLVLFPHARIALFQTG